jgi:hypothetical protein
MQTAENYHRAREDRKKVTIFIKKVILKEIEISRLLMRDIYISWTIHVINERRVYQTYLVQFLLTTCSRTFRIQARRHVTAVNHCRSRTKLNSMELSLSWEAVSRSDTQELSSPYTQEPSARPYPEPEQTSQYLPHPMIRFNIIHPPTSTSS